VGAKEAPSNHHEKQAGRRAVASKRRAQMNSAEHNRATEEKVEELLAKRAKQSSRDKLSDLLARGGDESDPGPEKKRSSHLLWLIPAVIVLLFFAAIFSNGPAQRFPSTFQKFLQSREPISQTSGSHNEANERLLALSDSEQMMLLGSAVNEGCRGNRTFYMGSSPKDNAAYWSVGCTNGRVIRLPYRRMRPGVQKSWTARS